MIAVEVLGLQLEARTGAPVVLLREVEEPNRVLPVFIGQPEARSIALGLEGVEPPRPMTHDLMASLLGEIDIRVDRVEVTELRDGTFFAEIALTGAKGTVRISSRPSDAIALAVRVKAPLFAAEAVLEEAGTVVASGDDAERIEEELAEFREFLDELDPSDFEGPPPPSA
jgi:uncharacterized protein